MNNSTIGLMCFTQVFYMKLQLKHYFVYNYFFNWLLQFDFKILISIVISRKLIYAFLSILDIWKWNVYVFLAFNEMYMHFSPVCRFVKASGI